MRMGSPRRPWRQSRAGPQSAKFALDAIQFHKITSYDSYQQNFQNFGILSVVCFHALCIVHSAMTSRHSSPLSSGARKPPNSSLRRETSFQSFSSRSDLFSSRSWTLGHCGDWRRVSSRTSSLVFSLSRLYFE